MVKGTAVYASADPSHRLQAPRELSFGLGLDKILLTSYNCCLGHAPELSCSLQAKQSVRQSYICACLFVSLLHAALNCAMLKMNMAERVLRSAVLPDYHRKGITLLIHTRKVPTAICKGIIAGEGINNTLLYVIPFYLIHTKTLNVFIQEIIKVI